MKIKSLLALAGLALSTTAHAAIVYTNLNSYQVPGYAGVLYVPAGSGYAVLHPVGYLGIDTPPLNNGLSFGNSYSTEDEFSGSSYSAARLVSPQTNLMQMTSSLLSYGSTVDASSILTIYGDLSPSDSPAVQYVGAAAKSGSDFYYGWVGFTIEGGKFTLKETAFNSTAGEGITVGQTSAGISAVPEPSSQLALIALGSAGLLSRRRTLRGRSVR